MQKTPSPDSTFEQPTGTPLPDWQGARLPPRTAMVGRSCRVEPLDPERHGAALYRAYAEDTGDSIWTYMSSGPFENERAFRAWVEQVSPGADPMFHAVVPESSGEAQGMASYMRIDAGNGVIEVGHIALAPALQRTRAATEAMYLMMRRVFDELGYRRYEWKCDSLNKPSRAAARRLGFSYEGTFRQAIVYKGRNRDTAWFSVIDSEWPALKQAFEAWLDPANFDAAGRQKRRLESFRSGD